MGSVAITDIDVREDGVYVLINTDSKTVKQDILAIISKYGVKDVDILAIDEAIKNNASEVKISSNTELMQKDESVEIKIDPKKMKVEITFIPPLNKGKPIDKETIINRLNAMGVVYGIKEDYLEELIKEKSYAQAYLVAEGEDAVDAKDGWLEFLFDTQKKTLKPKVLEDGSVDYRCVDIFEMALSGQKLVESHPPIEGKDGMNVFGKIIISKRGKLAPMFPKGKNVSVSQDSKYLVADSNGRIAYLEGKVSIQAILEIAGSVDNSVGNIEFLGTVVVKGDVVSGFTVSAGGNVEIEGVVEGATIKAKGDILLMKGVYGSNKGFIHAGGNVAAKFIESAEVVAGGDITADSIRYCSIKCGGVLELVGKNAVLSGGKCTVGRKIIAKTIGSSMATATELEVGLDYIKLQEYRRLVKEVEELNKEYTKTEKLIEMFSKFEVSALSDDKKKLLMDSIRTKIVIKSKIDSSQNKINELLPQLDNKDGVIKASNVVHSGVKVMIGNAVLYIHDDISFCTLSNHKAKVHISSYS